MPKHIQVKAHGGTDQLEWVDFSLREPGAGEVQLKQTAVGLNFIDVYHREGRYPTAEPPFGIGLEGAGIVSAVGPDVDAFEIGDRVAYGTGPTGAYAEMRNLDANRLVKLPEEIDDPTGAAMMLKGLTAQYLLRRTYRVKAGDRILVHAAAGGVGLILCQWAKHLGATVIGTVGTQEKAELARAHGCDHPILYTEEQFPQRVREITGGDLCQVVYDSVGKDTFRQSLECLAPLGMLVCYGQSSGNVPPFDLLELNFRGSLFLTRPSLIHYTAQRKDLLNMTDELFEAVEKGWVKINIGQTYPLAEAARAHSDLEARKTTGSTVLLV